MAGVAVASLDPSVGRAPSLAPPASFKKEGLRVSFEINSHGQFVMTRKPEGDQQQSVYEIPRGRVAESINDDPSFVASDSLAVDHGMGSSVFEPEQPELVITIENGDQLARDRLMAMIDEGFMTWRHRWFCILEGAPHEQDETLAAIFNITSVMFVLLSTVIFCLQSLPEYYVAERSQPLSSNPLFWIETVCIIIFCGEAILRVVCVPLSMLFNALYLIDILTILGYFVDVSLQGEGVSTVTASLRLFRVLRVFKLSRYSKSLQLVFYVLNASAHGLSMLVLPVVLVSVTGASLIYFFEVGDADWDPESRLWLAKTTHLPIQFQSIPIALYFTMTTIATVGYGDYVPTSAGGQVVAVGLMLFGVLALSFPNIVLGANLQLVFGQNRQAVAQLFLKKKFKKVFHAVSFIRAIQKFVKDRKKKEDGSLSAPLDEGNKFFFLTKRDFEYHCRKGIERITVLTIRDWAYRQINPVQLMQIILEGFSGVATATEIKDEFLDPSVRTKDIALVLMYLADAGYLKMYVLARNTARVLVCLTDLAVSELQLHPPLNDMECKRSVHYARFMWKQTTNTVAPFHLHPLHTGYAAWHDLEWQVSPHANEVADLKKVEISRNDASEGKPASLTFSIPDENNNQKGSPFLSWGDGSPTPTTTTTTTTGVPLLPPGDLAPLKVLLRQQQLALQAVRSGIPDDTDTMAVSCTPPLSAQLPPPR